MDGTNQDWDDILNNDSQSSHIANYECYNEDTPDSYKSVVEETTS